jgi:hypothetical protein
MEVLLDIALEGWTAHEAEQPRRRRRGTRVPHAASQRGSNLAFDKLLPRLSKGARVELCDGISDVEEELYDEAASAVRVRDIRTLDKLVEEIKFSSAAQRSCSIR